MWTRDPQLVRNWGINDLGMCVHPRNAPLAGDLARAGELALLLPPESVACDPSDSSTWTRPLIGG